LEIVDMDYKYYAPIGAIKGIYLEMIYRKSRRDEISIEIGKREGQKLR